MDGLFPPNTKANVFGPNAKQRIMPSGTTKQNLFAGGLFDQSVIDEMESAKKRVAEAEAERKEKIKNVAKHPLVRLYNAAGELLFITVTNQFQSVMRKDWHWLDPIVRAEFEWFHTRDEQEEAKFVAIKNEKPKYNSHNI